MELSRRNFIMKSSLVAAGISLAANIDLQAIENLRTKAGEIRLPGSTDQESLKISVFSKPLHWLDISEMANRMAGMGFDGIDLTVRPKGHVLPERVEEDLPKAVEAVKKAGIGIFTIVTAISNVDDPFTERILKTASSLGINHYRMGWLYYDENKTIEENLVIIQSDMSKLAVLNEKYKIHGEYQNHSGKFTPHSYFGSSIWDLYAVLKTINSPWLGSQYDIMHATVEGAYSWETNFKLLNPYVYSMNIKDFLWVNKNKKWTPQTVPLGEGMVDFSKYLSLLKQYRITGPVSVHYEYQYGRVDSDDQPTTLEKEQTLSALKNDLQTLKKYFREANLIH